MLNLNYYSDFQRTKFVDDYILRILGAADFKNLEENHFSRIDGDAKRLNILKYLMVHHSKKLRKIQSFSDLGWNQPFLEVLEAIIKKSEVRKDFKRLEDGQENDESRLADTNVLLQFAYSICEEKSVEQILRNTRVDFNQLKFKDERASPELFIEVFAREGRSNYLKALMQNNFNETKETIRFDILFEKCIEKASKNYEETLKFIIMEGTSNGNFEAFMNVAAQHENEFAIKLLIEKYGLPAEFRRVLNTPNLQKFLDYTSEDNDSLLSMCMDTEDAEKLDLHNLLVIFWILKRSDFGGVEGV